MIFQGENQDSENISYENRKAKQILYMNLKKEKNHPIKT